MVNFSKYSLYNNTETDGNYRDYYNPINLTFDSSDYYIIVTSQYRYKPGKLAYDLYGSERLNWVFTYFNRDKILDPIFDMTEGLIIRVPTKDRLLSSI